HWNRRRRIPMTDRDLLRLGILLAGALLMLAIWYFGTRPRKDQQVRRRPSPAPAPAGARREPQLAGDEPAEGEVGGADGDAAVSQPELGLEPAGAGSTLGRREIEDFDKIVSLYVAARAGSTLHGEDIVVAAEKTGLVFGHMNVFHRLLEGHPERGPVCSMASIIK